MTDWNALEGFLSSRFTISQAGPNVVILQLDLGENGTQQVWVRKLMSQGREYAVVAAPFLFTEAAQLQVILKECGTYTVGGAVDWDDMLFWRHALEMDGLDGDELLRTIVTIGSIADHLGRDFGSGGIF